MILMLYISYKCNINQFYCITAYQGHTLLPHLKVVPQSCTLDHPPRLPTRIVLQDCAPRLRTKTVHQDDAPRSHTKIAHQDCTPILHTKTINQDHAPRLCTKTTHQDRTSRLYIKYIFDIFVFDRPLG